MFEITYPIFIPSEPSGFALIVSGTITIAAYLAITGKWRELRTMATGENLTRTRASSSALSPASDLHRHESNLEPISVRMPPVLVPNYRVPATRETTPA